MAPTPKLTSKTKPLKPYRRGETLGKASRSSGKGSRATPTAPVSVKPVAVEVEKVESPFEEEEEEEEKAEEESQQEEEDEDAGDLPVEAPVPIKRKSSKKGKKFVESQADLLSLVASITGDADITKKAKLSKTKPLPKISEAQHKLDRAALKSKQLEAAKLIISSQTRAKKDRRNAREVAKKGGAAGVSKGPEGGVEPRKRVSFA